MTEARTGGPWWRGVTGYQWFVFAITSCAWLFDTMDQRLFSVARVVALADLMDLPGTNLAVQSTAKIATALFLLGWGLGGLTIGALGDRFGRVRLLVIAIALYAAGSALTAVARTVDEFIWLRVASGIGVGGVFGLAVTILSETVTGSTRLAMLGLFQALSAVGNMLAAFIKMGLDRLATTDIIDPQAVWRLLFVIGALPILLAAIAMFSLRETQAWRERKESHTLPRGLFGAYGELFRSREDRKRLFIGTVLSVSGIVGIWAIGEFAVDLQDAVFTTYYTSLVPPEAVRAQVANAKNWAYVLQMAGAGVGMMLFGWLAARIGRRPTFVIGFLAAFGTTVLAYWKLQTPADAYWMMPIMGAAQLSVLAGFAIYLPELFASRHRSTGVSFAYNFGRFAASGGGFFSALLTTQVFAAYPSPEPLRYSAMVMCVIFLIGAVAALMAPETKNAAMD